MELNKALRFKTINFMIGLLKKDINVTDNTIQIELQSDIYYQISTELQKGKIIRILIDHELMNIVKERQVVSYNEITDNYIVEFFVIRGVEGTEPTQHKASSNTVIRQVLTSELFETQYNSTELDKVLYDELNFSLDFTQIVDSPGFINNIQTSNVQINQSEYQGNLLVVDFDILQQYADGRYNPGYIDTSVSPVLFYPYMDPFKYDTVVSKLSMNSLILFEDITGIIHYYYITNITKNNDQIVCELQEIPSNSGVLQNISFVYSKYSKSLFIVKDGNPNQLYFVKQIIDDINYYTQQNIGGVEDYYYTTNQELYNVINSTGQNTAPGKYIGFFNKIDRLLTVTYYPNNNLTYSTNTLDPYPNKIVSGSRVLFDLTRNNLYVHNKDIIIDAGNSVSFYGNIFFKTGLTIDGKSDNLFRVMYSTNNKTYINLDNNPTDSEQDLTVSTINNFNIQTRYFIISDRNTTPNQIINIDTNTQTDRKLTVSNLNNLSINSNNISITSPTKTQLTVGDKLTLEALKSTDNLVNVNVDYINTLMFKNTNVISIRNSTTESINVYLSNQSNKTVTLSNLNNFSVLSSVNNVVVSPGVNVQLTAPNVSIVNVNVFNLSQKINTTERTVLTVRNTGSDLNVSVTLTNVNIFNADTNLVNINTKSISIKDGTNEYINLQTGTTNTLTINNLSSTNIISNTFSLRTGTSSSFTEKVSVNTNTILFNNSTIITNGSTLQFNTQSILTVKNGTTGNNVVGIKVDGTDNYLEVTTKNVRVYTTNNTKINLAVSNVEKEILSIVNNNNTSEFNVTSNKIYLEGNTSTIVNTNKFAVSTNTTEYLNITNTGTTQVYTLSNLNTIDVNATSYQSYKIGNIERLRVDSSTITTNITNLSIKYNTTTFIDVNTNTNSVNTTVKTVYTKVSDTYKLGVIYNGTNTTDVLTATNSASSVLLTLNANTITTISNTTNIQFYNVLNMGLPTKTYLTLKNDDTLSVDNLSTTTFNAGTSHLFRINGNDKLLINNTNVDITTTNLKQTVTDFNVGSSNTYLNLNTTNNLVNITTKDFNITTSNNITSNINSSFVQNVRNQFIVGVNVNNGTSQVIKNVLSISNSNNTTKVSLSVDNTDVDTTTSFIVRKGSYNHVILDTSNNTLTTQANIIYVNSNIFHVSTYINNGTQQTTTTVINVANTNNKQSLSITTNNFNVTTNNIDVTSDNFNTTTNNTTIKVSNIQKLMRDTTEYINVNLSTNTSTLLTVSNFNTISLTSNVYSINTGSTERLRVDSTNITINTSTLSIINNGNTFVTTNIVSDKGNYTFDRINNFTVKKSDSTNNELFKLSETILNISNLTTVDTDVSNYYFKVGGTSRITLNGTDLNVSSLSNITFTTTNLITDINTFIIKKGSSEYIKVTNFGNTQSTPSLTVGNLNTISVNQIINTDFRINNTVKLLLTSTNIDITQINVTQKVNNFNIQTNGGSNVFTVDTVSNTVNTNTNTVNINTNTLTFRSYINNGTSIVQTDVLTISNVSNTTKVVVTVTSTDGFTVNGNTVFNTKSIIVKDNTTEFINLVTGTTKNLDFKSLSNLTMTTDNLNTTVNNTIVKVSNVQKLMKDVTEYININLLTNTATSLTVTNFNTISLTSNNYSINTGSTERIKVDNTNVTINTSTLSIINNGNTFVTTNIVSDKGNYTFDRINNFTVKKVGTTNNELFKLNETALNVSNLTNVDINATDVRFSGTNVNISSTNFTSDVTTFTVKKNTLEYIKVTNSGNTQLTATLTIDSLNSVSTNQITNIDFKIGGTTKLSLTSSNVDIIQTNVTQKVNNFNIQTIGGSNVYTVDTVNNVINVDISTVNINTNTLTFRSYVNNGTSIVQSDVLTISNVNNSTKVVITTNSTDGFIVNSNTIVNTKSLTVKDDVTEFVNITTGTTKSLIVNNFNTTDLNVSTSHTFKVNGNKRLELSTNNVNVTTSDTFGIDTPNIIVTNNGDTFVTTSIVSDKGNYTFDRINNFTVKKVGTTNNELFKLSETILNISNLTNVDINVPNINLSGNSTNISSANLYVTSNVNINSGKVIINNDTLKTVSLTNIDTDASNYYFRVDGTSRVTLNNTDLNVSSINNVTFNVTFTVTNFTTDVTTLVVKKGTLEYIRVTNSDTTQTTASLTVNNLSTVSVNQITNTEFKINGATKLLLTSTNVDITQTNVTQKINNIYVQTSGGSNILTVDTVNNVINVNTSTVGINTNTLTFRSYINNGTSIVQTDVLTISNVSNTTKLVVTVTSTDGFTVNGNTVFNTKSVIVKDNTTEFINLITGTTKSLDFKSLSNMSITTDNLNTTINNTTIKVSNIQKLMRDTTEYININLSTNTATSVTFSNFNTISLTSNIYSINTGTTERIRVDSTNITINTSTLSIINNGNTFVTTNIVSDKGNYTFDRINNFTIKKVGTTNNELFKLSETILNISNLTNVDINVPNINISGNSTNISSTNLYVTSDINIKSGKILINNDTLKISSLTNIDTDTSNYYFRVGGTSRITLNSTDLTVSTLSNVTFDVTTFTVKKNTLEYIKVTNSDTTQTTATLTIDSLNNVSINQITNIGFKIGSITKLSLTSTNVDIIQTNVTQKTNNFSVQTSGGSNILNIDTVNNVINVNTSTVGINTNTLTFRSYVNNGTTIVQSDVLTISNVNNTTKVTITVNNTTGLVVNGNTLFNTKSLSVKDDVTEFVNITTGTTKSLVINNFNTTDVNATTLHTFKINGSKRLELSTSNVNVITSDTLNITTPKMLVTNNGITFINTTISATNTVNVIVDKLDTLTINKNATSNNTIILLNNSTLQVGNLTNVSISVSSNINITTQNVNTGFNSSYIVRSTTTPSVEFVNINATSNNITVKGNTVSVQKTDNTQTVTINTQTTGTTDPSTPTVTVNGTIKTNAINIGDKVYIQFNPTTNELEFVFV